MGSNAKSLTASARRLADGPQTLSSEFDAEISVRVTPPTIVEKSKCVPSQQRDGGDRAQTRIPPGFRAVCEANVSHRSGPLDARSKMCPAGAPSSRPVGWAPCQVRNASVIEVRMCPGNGRVLSIFDRPYHPPTVRACGWPLRGRSNIEDSVTVRRIGLDVDRKGRPPDDDLSGSSCRLFVECVGHIAWIDTGWAPGAGFKPATEV